MINKISNLVSQAQWVRRWSSRQRVVQAGGSSPGEDIYQAFFKNDFYFSFVRPNGLQSYSDIV